MKKFIKLLLKNDQIKFLLFTIHNHIFCRISNKGSKNKINARYAYLHKVKIVFKGSSNHVEILKDTKLYNTLLYFNGNNHFLQIGNNCTIKGGSIWFEDYNNRVFIERKTTIESAHLAVTGFHKKISLGEDCMLSQNIEIRTVDSHSILNKSTGQRINYEEDVAIGNHVWIGTNVIILKGVTLPNNIIIGTGAIVTKSVLESNCIIGGTPAKILKTDVDWARKRL
jgi:acetyltransferase-like isoleucine patch superfamily enzyme